MIYGKFIEKPEEIPTTEHWAIINSQGVFIPGDERSKINPGHGYPERTEHYLTYEMFDNEKTFKGELENRLSTDYQSKIVGIHVLGRYKVEKHVSISLTK